MAQEPAEHGVKSTNGEKRRLRPPLFSLQRAGRRSKAALQNWEIKAKDLKPKKFIDEKVKEIRELAKSHSRVPALKSIQ
jgi:hypothetical protein